MKTTALILGTFLFLVISYSCKKNQLGGKATIKGQVLHHEKPIAFARVFIKFKAKNFPGDDTTYYDAHVTADVEGNYSVKCYKGDYYLYGVGYDNQVPGNVYGGLSVHIRNRETVSVDVAVTE